MRKNLMLLLALACTAATAQVYQRIGPDGQVYFSDRPGSDAQPVEVRPAQSVTLPPVTTNQRGEGAAEQTSQAAAIYTRFAIVSPVNEEGVRANDGNVTIRLSLQPELIPGHVIQLNLDGEDGEQIKTRDDLDFALSNLSRGRHSVEAQVLDEKGNELMRAGPVNFYVLRFAGG